MATGNKTYITAASLSLPILLFAVISVLFFYPTIFKGFYPYQRDITYIFQPQQAYINSVIQGGELPLWNPYLYLGMPLMANWQSGIFSALSLPFYFFSSTVGVRIFYPLVMFLGGFFAFCFLRYKNFRTLPSLVGGLLWMLGGYFTTKLEFYSYISALSFSFAPLIFICYPVVAGVSLALTFLCGYPVFFLVFLTYAVFLFVGQNGISVDNRIKNFFFAVFIFGLIVLPQGLLTFELVRHSSVGVAGGHPPSVMLANSIEIKDILNFLKPFVEENVVGKPPHWLKSFYIGIIGSFCLVVGIIYLLKPGNNKMYRQMWAEKLWLLFFLSGLLLSTAPVYDFVSRYFAPLKFIRYPSSMMFLAMLSAVFISTSGADWIFRRINGRFVPMIFSVVIITELFFIGFTIRNKSSYVRADYFYEKPPVVVSLEEEGAVPRPGSRISRFGLAPKTLKLSALKGVDIADGWRTARYLLKGFVSLPYRLMNVYGFGEPLVPDYSERALDRAYKVPTPDEAARIYQESLGADYLVSATAFERKNSASYDLILNRESVRCYLYRLHKKSLSVFEITDGEGYHKEVVPAFWSEGRVVFDIFLPSDKKDIFFVARGGWVYPGWEVYLDGKRVNDDAKREEAVLKVPLSTDDRVPRRKLTLLYIPSIFSASLMFLCAGIAAVCYFYISRLKRIFFLR